MKDNSDSWCYIGNWQMNKTTLILLGKDGKFYIYIFKSLFDPKYDVVFFFRWLV